MKPVKVGICGLGTVGGGTFNVLKRNAEEIARRAGRGIEVAQIAARRPNPKCDTGATPITADIFDVACNPEIDVVVELIGGYTLAHELVLKAIETARGEFGQIGQWALTSSLASLPVVVNVMIYLVLVPILVFFFLKDKKRFQTWFHRYLPRERGLMKQVWAEMNQQIANYIRGKVIEIVITGAVTYIAFAYLGLNYAALLALLVGLSVVVPYIGAVVVSVPVAMIAFFQWGWSDQFIYLMVAHAIIQALDGNVLVPLLFSEAVNLHPVAIICAVLLFGGLWGFWGVFFAIPLATLVKAVLDAWPKDLPETPAATR
ncbi:MAG: AI-2E family transporter [Pseudomonas aeruginosa]|nr:AI-2E family transporter [Pseudomonas aeruginosa]